MCPEPDYEKKIGALLIRRWGDFVRLNLGERTVGFRLPWKRGES